MRLSLLKIELKRLKTIVAKRAMVTVMIPIRTRLLHQRNLTRKKASLLMIGKKTTMTVVVVVVAVVGVGVGVGVVLGVEALELTMKVTYVTNLSLPLHLKRPRQKVRRGKQQRIMRL